MTDFAFLYKADIIKKYYSFTRRQLMLGTQKQKTLPLIDDQEKQRRSAAYRNAEASLRIEGFFLRSECKAILEDWKNGLITDQERNKLIRNLP